MKWRLLICCCCAFIVSLAAGADTLAVAGHAQHLERPLVTDRGEVLAPLLPWLRLLGATATVKGATVAISTPGRPALKLTLGSTAYTADGTPGVFPVAPRVIADEPCLPARALAPLLGAAAHFDAISRTLTLLPLIDLNYELRPEGLAVLVRSAAPLQFTRGEVADPPRLFFDFKSAAVSAEQQLPLQAGVVEQLRLAQYSQSPATARLAIDCLLPAAATATVDEAGRLVTIIITKRPEPPATQPGEPAPLAPARLREMTLSQRSAKLSELRIAAGGPTQVTCDYESTTKTLTVTVQNGLNGLDADRLRALKGPIVQSVEASGTPDTPGTVLTVVLAREAGFLVQQDDESVRLLVGTFDISDMTVTLDAGHGGYDSGAVGVNGTREKDVNLDVIRRAGKLLEQAGAKVIYTRGDDTFIPLNNRPDLANRRRSDLFISTHCNSMPRPNTASGTQTYYCTGQSKGLATAMHTELVKGLGLKDGGVRSARFLVIRKSQMPAVLLELAFINNTQEEALLASPAFRQKAAAAIVAGIRRYAASTEWQLRRSEIPINLGAPTMATTPEAIQ